MRDNILYFFKSADESLVDFTIDPNSSKREFGLSPLEEKLEENLQQTQVIQKAATYKDIRWVPIFGGSDCETG